MGQRSMEQKRIERVYYIKTTLKKEDYVVSTFKDVYKAMQVYFIVTGQKWSSLEPELQLSDF